MGTFTEPLSTGRRNTNLPLRERPTSAIRQAPAPLPPAERMGQIGTLTRIMTRNESVTAGLAARLALPCGPPAALPHQRLLAFLNVLSATHRNIMVTHHRP